MILLFDNGLTSVSCRWLDLLATTNNIDKLIVKKDTIINGKAKY